MSRARDLLRNTAILMVAKTSTQVVSFFLLPLYTTLLTAEDYGRVDVYTSLAMIVIPFMTLQLEMALFRYFITSKSRVARKEIISCSYAMILGMVLVISVIYLIISAVLQLPYRWLLYFYYVSLAIAAMLLQTCRALGDNIGYGVASFISSALSVALNVIFITGFRWNVEGVLISSVIAQIVSCVYMLFRTRVYLYLSICHIHWVRCKELMKYSIPLIFNQVASWAINYSNRLIIVAQWGEGINGIFSVASKFSNITSTIFGVYNVAWTENVVRCMHDDDGSRYISRMIESTFNIYLILITGIINVMPFMFGILVNNAFHAAYQHVPILLVGMLFSGMAATLGSIYIAYSRTKEVGITTMLAGLCNIFLHFLLLRSSGLYAASLSTLISFAVLFFYRYIYIKKFFVIRFRVKWILLQAVILIFAWISYAIKSYMLSILGLTMNLACAALLFIGNKTMIKGIKKK